MLIDILKNIFINNEFSETTIDFLDYKCFLYRKNTEDNFFIILDKESISDSELDSLISQGFLELYNKLEKLEVTDKTFEKNATLVLCLQSECELINKIEEDSYLFKKNIIVYSERMKTALLKLVEDNYSLSNINNLLNNDSMFENSKNNQNDGYTLLSRLFIKLPFLTYERGVRELDNLSEIIQKKSKDEGIEKLYKQFVELDINTNITYQNLVENGIIIEVENE